MIKHKSIKKTERVEQDGFLFVIFAGSTFSLKQRQVS